MKEEQTVGKNKRDESERTMDDYCIKSLKDYIDDNVDCRCDNWSRGGRGKRRDWSEKEQHIMVARHIITTIKQPILCSFGGE